MANVISVTALNRYVKSILESDAVLTDIALRGEVSNFTNHYKTGHFYFTLKDEKCAVKAVMFRSYAQQLSFVPENGMRVIVRCRVSLFERDGAFQVYVEDLFPDGLGAMQMAFEQLKARLEREGLFAPEHKKPLPRHPRRVGLVTSKTGAAIQDILNVTRRRCPAMEFVLCPVNVQGAEAAPGIVRAIQALGARSDIDVIIVARGGGSREDLWVFNDEAIARAAYACRVPLVSAIGHEIDFCILDFVADLRAPTPSAAAELVAPDLWGEFSALCRLHANIQKSMQKKLALCYNKMQAAAGSSALRRASRSPQREREQLCAVAAKLCEKMHGRMQTARQAFSHDAALAHTLNPYAVLARGYAVVQGVDNQVVRRAAPVPPGEARQVRLFDGMLLCTVDECRPADKTLFKPRG